MISRFLFTSFFSDTHRVLLPEKCPHSIGGGNMENVMQVIQYVRYGDRVAGLPKSLFQKKNTQMGAISFEDISQHCGFPIKSPSKLQSKGTNSKRHVQHGSDLSVAPPPKSGGSSCPELNISRSPKGPWVRDPEKNHFRSSLFVTCIRWEHVVVFGWFSDHPATHLFSNQPCPRAFYELSSNGHLGLDPCGTRLFPVVFQPVIP